MRRRIALIVGSAAAAATLAVGLAAAGFGPATAPDAGAMAASDPTEAQAAVEALLAPWDGAGADLAPTVTVEEEVVYIRPAATPRIIRVTRVAAASARGAAADDAARRGRAGDREDREDDREDREDEREDEREDRREDREDEREDD